jgi:hypothetical protein
VDQPGALGICSNCVVKPGAPESLRVSDLLLDMTPGALRGVEVACRSRGGWGTVKGVRELKAPGLVEKSTLAEVHVSVWCGWPRVSDFCKVKP